jgi:hypothetical protein
VEGVAADPNYRFIVTVKGPIPHEFSPEPTCHVFGSKLRRVLRFCRKPEPLAVLDLHSGRFRCFPEMVGDECGRGEGNAAFCLQGWEHEVCVLPVGRLAVPHMQNTAPG